MAARYPCYGGPIIGRRHEVADTDRDRIKDLLPGRPGQHGGRAEDHRRFINAVLYGARTGIPRRDLPERLGNWNSRRRPGRWAKAGRFAAPAAPLRDPDLDVLILAPTVIRAHPRAAGPKRSGAGPGAGPSRPRAAAGAELHGGFDGLGQPVELIRTPGRASDIGQAEPLPADHGPEAVAAARGYDEEAAAEGIERRGAEAVIPRRKGDEEQREVDAPPDRERHLCERPWGQAERSRRVATRYEKEAADFPAFAWVAAVAVMLK